MQNEPNFQKVKMNINKVVSMEYEKGTLGERGKNEPKTNPIEANLQKAQMYVNKVLTKDYENISNWTLGENEPKTNPIKPNLSRRSLWRSRIKPNFTSAQRRRTAVQRIKNPLQLPSQISRLSKRRCYKSLKKVIKIKCPTSKRF